MALSLMFGLGLLFLPLSKANSILPLLHSMERLVDFYATDFHNLNVDGLFGLRVLEGHFHLILKKGESLKLGHLDPDIITRIRAMKKKASQTADLAIQHVKKDNAHYYEQLSYVVGSPWDVFDDVRRQVDPALVWTQDVYHQAKKTVELDEEVSDKCMSELIGSHRENGSLCDISTACVNTMTSPGLVGYGNTHQILWSMLAQKAGCTDKLEEKLKEANRGTLVSLRREMCTNNFYQLKETLTKMDNNLVTPAFQDLFLEQLFICPSLGYYEFLHPDFLPQILSWQLILGCFGKMKKQKSGIELDERLKGQFSNDYDEDEDGFDKLLEGLQLKNVMKDGVLIYSNTTTSNRQKQKAAAWETAPNKGRKLLVEKTMTGGCLAHKTAVGSGALVMYLRFLCEADADVTFNISRLTRSVQHIDNKPLLKAHKGNLGLDKQTLATEQNLTGIIGSNQENLRTHSTHVKTINMIQKMEEVDQHEGDNIKGNINDVKDSMIANGGLDVKNDMSDLNHHLYQLNSLDLNEKTIETKESLLAPRNQHFHVGKGNYNMEEEEDEDDDYQVNGDRGDEDDIDDDVYDDDDDNINKEDENDDDYYDEREIQGNDLKISNAMLRDGPQEKNQFNDNYDSENDDEYNAGYDDNDKQNVDNFGGIQPHINLRKIGRPDYRLNNDEDMQDYKYQNEDDEEENVGDDYVYDDENDEMAKRHQEELKGGDVQLENAVKKTKTTRQGAIQKHIVHSEVTLSPSTAFFVFGFCLTLVLILMYKFIRKRRIRIRFNPKYFSV